MNIRNLLAGTALLAFTFYTVSATATTSAQDFVTKASIANEFEIDASKLALDKSQNNAVKQFAQQMIDDHTQTGENLKTTLQSAHLNIEPSEELDRKHQKMLDKLQDSSSEDFDHTYIKMQTKAHKEAVDLFTDYSQHGKNDALKNFASQTLPTLQAHLDHVEQLKANE